MGLATNRIVITMRRKLTDIITKRVFELERHDVFIWMGSEFAVTNINGRIRYRSNVHSHHAYSFGLFNQMKVEFLYNTKHK